jgi:hypothetical protein
VGISAQWAAQVAMVLGSGVDSTPRLFTRHQCAESASQRMLLPRHGTAPMAGSEITMLVSFAELRPLSLGVPPSQ